MKDVCMECRYRKPKSKDYLYCVKYGCPIHYGRVYCVSWQSEEKVQYIIQKGNEFLVAIAYPEKQIPRYSTSPWDAAPIYSMEDARLVAEKVGGEVRTFNPVSGVIG